MAGLVTRNTDMPLTAAENALVELFNDLSGSLPGNADVVVARDRAVQAIKTQRLPTRKVEAFHYTDLRRLLTSIPDTDAGHANVTDPLLEGSHLFALAHGELVDRASIAGIQAEAVADSLRADVGGVTLGEVDAGDAVGAINTAFVSDGLRLTVADGARVESPVEIQCVHDGGQVHTRHVINVGAGAKVFFIDRQFGSDQPALASTVTELTARKGADVQWVLFQDQGAAATHLGSLKLTLEEGARANIFIANVSGRLVRQEVHAQVTGEGAELAFRAINLIGGDSHCDVTLELDHLVANTTSTEAVRNVVTGRGQGVFQGQIRVAQPAQKTDAQMACNTLLLSDHGGFATKPELEIFADDVVCAHGATVAEINERHLFYLMARGISEKTARSLLIEAFVDALVEELEDEALIAVLENRIAAWLEAHG